MPVNLPYEHSARGSLKTVKAMFNIDTLLRFVGRQEWLRVGLRYYTINRFVNPKRSGSRHFEVNFYGLKYKGDLGQYIDWWVYYFGAYEKAELLLMRDIVARRRNAVCVDVGANVGQHSLFLSRYCAEVHAFEPLQYFVAALQCQIIPAANKKFR
ncbi:MAG: hypothetical protein RMK84_01260 [Oscillochloridaceae bacterium]|nr:hypothetical protein [Chloroflexaceae bacterium]MDW8388727.1 hypothetical protein [Oscillochloridaceae bacterium]